MESAIEDIKSGGFDVIPDVEIKVGGFLYAGGGDVQYYFTCRRMELGVLEDKKPSLTVERVMNKFKELYPTIPKSIEDMHNDAIEKSGMGDLIFDQLMKAENNLSNLNTNIIKIINERIKSKDKTLKLKIPAEVISLPIQHEVMYDPNELHKLVNDMISYITVYDLKVLDEDKKKNLCIPKADAPDLPSINLKEQLDENIITSVSSGEKLTIDKIFTVMKYLLDKEKAVCMYLKKLELYHAYIIERLNTINEACSSLLKP